MKGIRLRRSHAKQQIGPESSRKSGLGKISLHGDHADNSLYSDERGTQLLEFALVAPMMLMIMLGIAVISSTMSNFLQLNEATGAAARAVSIARSNTLDPCNTVYNAVTQGAPLLNSSNLSFTLTLYSSTGASLYSNGPTQGSFTCSSGTYTSGPPSYLQSGGTATVNVTYPCDLTIYGKNYAPSCVLHAQTSEMVQ